MPIIIFFPITKESSQIYYQSINLLKEPDTAFLEREVPIMITSYHIKSVQTESNVSKSEPNMGSGRIPFQNESERRIMDEWKWWWICTNLHHRSNPFPSADGVCADQSLCWMLHNTVKEPHMVPQHQCQPHRNQNQIKIFSFHCWCIPPAETSLLLENAYGEHHGAVLEEGSVFIYDLGHYGNVISQTPFLTSHLKGLMSWDSWHLQSIAFQRPE